MTSKCQKYLSKLLNTTDDEKFGVYLTKLNHWYNVLHGGKSDGIYCGYVKDESNCKNVIAGKIKQTKLYEKLCKDPNRKQCIEYQNDNTKYKCKQQKTEKGDLKWGVYVTDTQLAKEIECEKYNFP